MTRHTPADPAVLALIESIDPYAPADEPLFDASRLAALRALPSVERKLLAIAGHRELSADLRYVAAQALLEGDWDAWRATPDARREVAQIVVSAMARDRAHNRWGLPGLSVGPYGRRLLSLGAEACAALGLQLDNRERAFFEGGEAATRSDASEITIADLAAWLRKQGGCGS